MRSMRQAAAKMHTLRSVLLLQREVSDVALGATQEGVQAPKQVKASAAAMCVGVGA